MINAWSDIEQEGHRILQEFKERFNSLPSPDDAFDRQERDIQRRKDELSTKIKSGKLDGEELDDCMDMFYQLGGEGRALLERRTSIMEDAERALRRRQEAIWAEFRQSLSRLSSATLRTVPPSPVSSGGRVQSGAPPEESSAPPPAEEHQGDFVTARDNSTPAAVEQRNAAPKEPHGSAPKECDSIVVASRPLTGSRSTTGQQKSTAGQPKSALPTIDKANPKLPVADESAEPDEVEGSSHLKRKRAAPDGPEPEPEPDTRNKRARAENSKEVTSDAHELTQENNGESSSHVSHETRGKEQGPPPQIRPIPRKSTSKPARKSQPAATWIQPTRPRRLRGREKPAPIISPTPGKLYISYWRVTRDYWAVLLLPFRNLGRVGVPGTLDSLGLLDPLPECFTVEPRTRTLSWKRGYEDGGELVTKRQFPIVYIDNNSFPDESVVGWAKVTDLRELDLNNFDDPETPFKNPQGVRRFIDEFGHLLVNEDIPRYSQASMGDEEERAEGRNEEPSVNQGEEIPRTQDDESSAKQDDETDASREDEAPASPAGNDPVEDTIEVDPTGVTRGTGTRNERCSSSLSPPPMSDLTATPARNAVLKGKEPAGPVLEEREQPLPGRSAAPDAERGGEDNDPNGARMLESINSFIEQHLRDTDEQGSTPRASARYEHSFFALNEQTGTTPCASTSRALQFAQALTPVGQSRTSSSRTSRHDVLAQAALEQLGIDYRDTSRGSNDNDHHRPPAATSYSRQRRSPVDGGAMPSHPYPPAEMTRPFKPINGGGGNHTRQPPPRPDMYEAPEARNAQATGMRSVGHQALSIHGMLNPASVNGNSSHGSREPSRGPEAAEERLPTQYRNSPPHG